ncbi:MAG: SMP-30/gluconolactonase/LRE family protein [Phyllobacterium sp.]
MLNNPKADIFCDIPCALGEGPGYDPSTQTVWWFDILAGKLLEKAYPDGVARVHDLGVMASAMAIIDAERQLLVTERGLLVRNRKTGRLTDHLPIEADNPRTRSNDARVHPSGAFWIGTMGKKAEQGAGSIYWYRGGELRLLYPDITITNSICFSPDGCVAYFADTDKNIVWRVDTDPEKGLPTSTPAIFLEHRGIGGVDGSVVDRDGNLWNARWGAGSVDCYSPEGKHVRSVAVPATQASCPAFVGPNGNRLAVTSAREGLTTKALAETPLAGQTFLIDLPVKGRFDPPVRL